MAFPSAVFLLFCFGAAGAAVAPATDGVLSHCTQDDPMHSDLCKGYFDGGKSWCYLMDEAGEYAKGKKKKCETYNTLSAEKWCYHPTKKPAHEEEITGQGTHRSGNTEWTCPAKWFVDGHPTDPDAKEWTMGTNVFRCMHGVQFAKWSNFVADDMRTYLTPLTSMQHSDSYNVPPPAGPAAENLFWGSGSWTDGDANEKWYTEGAQKCKGKKAGCDGGPHGTAHFTAMIWAGVREIGCASNMHGLKGCRYKGGDKVDCSTPNMGGCYEENVFESDPPNNGDDFAACKEKVESCFGEALPQGLQGPAAYGGAGVNGPAVGGPMRRFNVGDGMRPPRRFPWVPTAVVAISAMLTMGVFWRLWSRRRAPEPQSTLLVVESEARGIE